jgi:hypothetical protein
MERGKAAIRKPNLNIGAEKPKKIATVFVVALLFLCLVPLAFELVSCLPAPGYDREVEADFVLDGKPVRASLAWTETEAATQQPSSGTSSQGGKGTDAQQGSGTGQNEGAKIDAPLMLTGAASAAALVGGGMAVKKAMGNGSSTEAPKDGGQTPAKSDEGTQWKEDEQVKRAKSGNMGSGSIQSDPAISTSNSGSSYQTPAGSSARPLDEQYVRAKAGSSQTKATSPPILEDQIIDSITNTAAASGAIEVQRRLDEQQMRAKSGSKGTASTSSNSKTDGSSNANSYAPYVAAVAIVLIVVVSVISLGLMAPGAATIGAGVGISASQGAGIAVGAGIGFGAYAMYNLGIMNYPKQPTFAERHTTQYTQQQTSEMINEKGSGRYGEDVAEEQLEQAELAKDRIMTWSGGNDHRIAQLQAERWLKEVLKQKNIDKDVELDLINEKTREIKKCRLDIISEDYIVECKTGTEQKSFIERFYNQAEKYLKLAKQEGKTLIYWFLEKPSPYRKKLWDFIHWLDANEIDYEFGDDYFVRG